MSDYRTGGYQTTTYQQRRNAERLAAQHPDVQGAAQDILKQLKSIEQYVYWALGPEEKDGGAYYAQNLLEHAHELIDQAHAFRAGAEGQSAADGERRRCRMSATTSSRL